MKPPGEVQPRPFVVDCEPGKYAYCACQRSGSFPYCDGTHRGSDTQPIKVIFDEPRTVAWCACARSANKPYCDGSHSQA